MFFGTARMKMFAAALVVLSLLSLGLSAPLGDCESLVKPISISKDQILGRWFFMAGSSDIPGSRSLAHLMTSVWVDISATSQNNVLNIVQNQKILGKCSSLAYNVTFENSTLLIEQPFYLKEVYLPTDCSDCLIVYEEIISGKNTFRSFLLFSKSNTVASADVEMLKRQAQCLKMPSITMTDTNGEFCQDNIPSSNGLAAFQTILQAKMGLQVASFLDTIFDWFVN